MINPPSSQKPYDEFWSGDPAFVQPPDNPGDDAEAEAAERYQKALTEYQRKVRLARETGDWSGILLEGGSEPTKFHVRPLKGHQYRWLVAQAEQGAVNMLQLAALTFRTCIVDLVNGGEPPLKPEQHKHLGQIMAVDVTDYLDRIDTGIVNEIGLALFNRGAQGLSPLS